MHRRSILVAVVALPLLATGCKASAYYEAANKMRAKNAHAAIEYIALCLAEEPEHVDAIDLLDEICQRIGDEHRTRLEDYARNGSYEDGVAQCDRLLCSAKVVSEMPGKRRVPVNAEDRTKFAGLAAKKYYEAGKKYEQQGLRKEAAIAFRRSIGFVPGYEDAAARYEENRLGALKRVVVIPFHGPGEVAPAVENAIVQGVVSKRTEFLELVAIQAAKEAHGRGNVSGQLQGFVEVAWSDTGWDTTPGENSVLEPVFDGMGRPVKDPRTGFQAMRQRRATWTVHRRTVTARLNVRYEVKERSGAIMAAGSTGAENSESGIYAANFRGDVDHPGLIPQDVLSLPTQAPVLASPIQLAQARVNDVAATLANDIFMKFK